MTAQAAPAGCGRIGAAPTRLGIVLHRSGRRTIIADAAIVNVASGKITNDRGNPPGDAAG
jgi:hypothetical protein